MKNLFIPILLALVASLFGQPAYEQSMDNTMEQWENASTPQEFGAIAKAFEQIVEEYPNEWEPRYYAILGKTIHAYYLPKKESFELIKKLENDYQALKNLIDNDETKVLHGMILTVKVSKKPMKYGRSLTPIIRNIYHQARKENPNNPRVVFKLAEYEMHGAPYMGKDLKEFCPLLSTSITLFEQEANKEKTGYEPHWGINMAQKLYDKNCL